MSVRILSLITSVLASEQPFVRVQSAVATTPRRRSAYAVCPPESIGFGF